jgi:DNA-binding NtrC family response regulator
VKRAKLLIVDDRDRYVELCHALLRDNDYATRCAEAGPCWTCAVRPGCTLTHAHDLSEAREALAKNPDVDVVLMDLAFDLPEARLAPSDERDLDRRRAVQGLDILRALRRDRPRLPVVLMTERATLDYADAADSVAVDEYLTLAGADAFDARALALLVERSLARSADPPDARYVWGESGAMGRLRRDLTALARTSLPMLLLGETGTGKSRLAAEVIHPTSGRRGAFVTIDLSAIPGALVAAELFGSARGAFSGAVDRAGALEAANGGTLFLDEIGNLPLEAQRVLLVALDRGEVTRLGETRTRPVDVKLVAATNGDLRGAVRAGTFRADLLARLNPSVRIELPPLRERLEDLPRLLTHFVRGAFERASDRVLLEDYARRAGLSAGHALEVAVTGGREEGEIGLRFTLDRASFRELRAHAWPGNLRELRSVASTLALLTLADASALAQRREREVAPRELPVPRRLVRELIGAHSPAAAGTAGPASSLHAVARQLERDHYERLFEETKGDFARMARRLLGVADAAAARKVRLRFNQLGLRVRRTMKS